MQKSERRSERRKFLALVIDKARNTSPLAGNSWMFCLNGRILVVNKSIHGTDTRSFIEDCERYGAGADLYLSSIPHQLFISRESLQTTARRTEVNEIFYPAVSPSLEAKFIRRDREIESKVPMKALPLHLSDLRNYRNLENFYRVRRPWVIGITSGNLCGEDTPLQYFSEQYGAYEYLIEQCKKVHFVMKQDDFCPLIIQDKLQEENQPIFSSNVKDISQVSDALDNGYLKNQTTCVLLSSLTMMQELISEGKVDEVIYYVLLNNKNKNPANPINNFGSDWEVSDCQNLNVGLRVNLRRKGCYLFNNLEDVKSIKYN